MLLPLPHSVCLWWKRPPRLHQSHHQCKCANDAPQFLGAPYTAAIDEGLSSGFTLLTASAIDDDSGDTLQYSLLGTNNADFAISSSTGLISTAKSLDYETVTSYALTVSVQDGKTTVTTSLTITVNNKNDAPVFKNAPYLKAVDENDAGARVDIVSYIVYFFSFFCFLFFRVSTFDDNKEFQLLFLDTEQNMLLIPAN